MPYERNANWVDGEGARATPITAVKLNKVEDGVVAASKNAEAAVASAAENKTAVVKAQADATQALKNDADHWNSAQATFAKSTEVKAVQDAINTLKTYIDGDEFLVKLEKYFLRPFTNGPTVPVGAVFAWVGVQVPENYFLCDGRKVNKSQYPQLYSVCRNLYGPEEGGNFVLPNLQGMVLVGRDETNSVFRNLNNKGGEITHTLTVAEMPAHEHKLGNPSVANWGDMGIWGSNVSGGTQWNIASGTAGGSMGELKAQPVGANNPHNNMPPYTVLNYIIRAK